MTPEPVEPESEHLPDPATAAAARPRSVAVSVVVGVLLAAAVVGALVAGRTAFFVLALVAVLIAQLELYRALAAAGRSPATAVGLVCGAALLVGTYIRGPIALTLLVAMPLALLSAWALTVPVQEARHTFASTYLGIVYAPVLASFAVLLLRGADGRVLVPAFIGMSQVQDSGAYLIGRRIGRRRMSPRISPGKSWEGLAAGTACSVALSCAILPWTGAFSLKLAFALSLVMCLVTPLGDLAESLVKRDLGVKDMGSIVPGHGGVFDRIDAVLFCAPVAYMALRLWDWASW